MADAPAFFQSIMNDMKRDMKLVGAYLDDSIVFGKSVKEHLLILDKWIDKLAEKNFRIQPTKSQLFCDKVEFLGHIIDGSGIKANPKRLAEYTRMATPISPKQLQKFLGRMTYVTRHLPFWKADRSELYNLMNDSNTKFQRHEQEVVRKHCEIINAQYAHSIPLNFPKSGYPLHLYTDASVEGIGCVLAQIIDGEVSVIDQFSKILGRSQKNWSVYRKELYAVTEGVAKWRKLLNRWLFYIHVDNKSAVEFTSKSMVHTLNDEKQSKIVQRWIATIAEFNFGISHIAGEENLLADFLSRDPQQLKSTVDIGISMVGKGMMLDHINSYVDASSSSTNHGNIVGPNPRNTIHMVKTMVTMKHDLAKADPPDLKTKHRLLRDTHMLDHASSTVMMHRIMEAGFYWKELKNECIAVCRQCERCLKFNSARKVYNDPMQVSAVVPWSHIQIDLAWSI